MHDTWGETRWSKILLTIPNLSLASADFTLAFPPRVSFPWRKQ